MPMLALPIGAALVQIGYLLFARSVLAAWARQRVRRLERADAEPGRSPAALRYLLRRRFGWPTSRSSTGKLMALDLGLLGEREDDAVALTATVLDLAARGYITIEKSAASCLVLVRVEGSNDDLPPEEEAVLATLFPNGGRYLELRASGREAVAAKRALEDVLTRDVGGSIFALHRRWATIGYLLSGGVALASLGFLVPTTLATMGRWVTGLSLFLSVPSGIAFLVRALHETRRHSGHLVPVRTWGAALGAFFYARRLWRILALQVGALLLAKVLGLAIIFDQSRWTSHVGLGPTVLSFGALAIFALIFTVIQKRGRLALAVEFAMFLCWALALGFAWWELGGALQSALALAMAGAFSYAIGPAILRAPTEIDDDLAAAVDEHRAALAIRAVDSASSTHPFRTPGSIDRSLAYAVALDADLPQRCPPWFQGDWDALGGSAGFVQCLADVLR